MSPSRRGVLIAVKGGRTLPLPRSLNSPSWYAASIAFWILSIKAVSDFGMIRLTEYFGVAPSALALGSFAFK